MSKEAEALLQKLLMSGIDAVGFHCRDEPPPPEEPEKPEPKPY